MAPQLIEPHVMTDKSKAAKSEKASGKRKNTKDSTYSKKLRTFKTPPSPVKSPNKSFNEERRRKLKELNSKSPQDGEGLRKSPRSRTSPKVKVM